MKLVILLTLFLSTYVNAYSLQEIKESLKTNSKTKSVEFRRASAVAGASLINSYDAPVLGATLSHADAPDESGVEYSVGISQEIEAPFSTSSRNRAAGKTAMAIKQEAKYELHILELDVSSKYYAACTSMEMKKSSESLFEAQKRRYKQFENAYKLGEISKKDLLFNKLDLAKLRQDISRYKLIYLEELSSLQESVDTLKIERLDCNDLIAPTKNIMLQAIEEHSELKALEYKRDASKALYETHDTLVQSIGYELLYEKELDTDRYTVGINMPLGFVSSKQELLRVQELSMSSSYEKEKEFMKHEIQNGVQKIRTKLELMFYEFSILQDEILPLNQELLDISKSALAEGEGTVMEYIDASRSYSENLLGMLELKKNYYYELFELYKTADMKHGE